tara:strand:- start:14 stop:943 length:930 start_codon:yes stop_codon:yes gene_type:complete
LRTLGTILIAIHLFLSAWLVIQFEGQYTEGQPSPTEVQALIAIDKEQTLIDVEMKNSTSFLLYIILRDYDDSIALNQGVSDNTSSENDSESLNDSQESNQKSNQRSSMISESEQHEPVEWLKSGRKATLAALVLVCLSELICLISIPFNTTLRAVLWMGVVICFSVVIPATYVLDLGEDNSRGDDGPEESDGSGALARETFITQTEDGAIAHERTSIENSLIRNGIRFEMMFSGYDLGLIEPENYSHVRSEIPNQNSSHANSYVEFQSNLELRYGKNIPSVFLIPLLWFFFPAKSEAKSVIDSNVLEAE